MVLQKLEIMYSSLRSLQEYSQNYTTEILQSLSKYKSTTLDLVKLESQYKETKLLLENTQAIDNTHPHIKDLLATLIKLEDQLVTATKTLKTYELDNDKKFNFKNPEQSEYLITFNKECETFESYLTQAKEILRQPKRMINLPIKTV